MADLDRSLDDKFHINILCYSMAGSSSEFFHRMITLFNKHLKQIVFSPLFQNELKDKGKSTIFNKDWSQGLVRCRYLVRSPVIDWSECQIYYRCHAAIMLFDMQTCDVQKVAEEIAKVKKNMTTEQISVYRVFAFNCIQEHMKCFQDEKLSLLVGAAARDEDLLPVLRDGIESLLYSTAIHFFMEMVRLKLDNHTIPLFHTKEEDLKDTSKIKKRKQGRSLKLCGDMSLMLGCHKDAIQYYAQAYDILKSNDDYLWMGKVKEAQAACFYLEYLFNDTEEKTSGKLGWKVVEAIKEKMEGASVYYRKAKSAKSADFDKECFFKLIRVLKDFNAQTLFSDFVKFYVDNSQYVPPNDEHYRIMLKISSYFYEMKMYRKAGFFLKLVGDMILNSNPDLARDIYLICFPLYNIPLSREILPDNFPKNDFLKVLSTNKEISQEIRRVAPMIQLQLVNDVLAISSSDIPLQTKIISIILHYFLEDINNYTQQKLYNHLITLGNTLNKNLKLDLTYLPEVVRVTPVPEVIKVNIKLHEGGADKGSVFIYNPWKKGGANTPDYNWMVGNVCYIKVFLRNVFDFEIFVDMIMLVTEGVNTITYPTSVILRKTKSLQELTLKFKPLETGTINVLGIISKLSNFVHFHPINAKGVAIKTYTEQNKLKEGLGIRKVPIKEKIGTLKIYFEETGDEIKLYENSRFSTKVIIDNKSECTICLRKLLISFAFSDNTTLDKELTVSGIEVKNYETFSVVICRSVPEEEHFIQDILRIEPHILLNIFDIPNADKIFKFYVKLIYYEKEKPNISIEDNVTKEIKMVKSLSVSSIHVYDSIAPDQVTISGKDYKHISTDECFYLCLDVKRDDPENNKNDYIVSFYLRGIPEALIEKTMLGASNTVKLMIKTNREILKGHETNWDEIKKMFYGKWSDINSIETGYLFLTDVDIMPIIEKIENVNIKFSVETQLEKVNSLYQPVIGDINSIKVKVNLPDKKKRSLHLSVVLSEETSLSKALLKRNDKGVLYKGKKMFLATFGEEKQEECVEVKVMFTNAQKYSLFCFAVDEEISTVYSYKYPVSFKAK